MTICRPSSAPKSSGRDSGRLPNLHTPLTCIRWRPMISGYVILPALIIPASRALVTVCDAPRRYGRDARLLTCDSNPGFAHFRYHDHRQGGQALRLASCYGMGSFLSPSTSRRLVTLSLSRMPQPIPLRFPTLFRIVGLSKPGLTPM
jgi:hypothetical protein